MTPNPTHESRQDPDIEDTAAPGERPDADPVRRCVGTGESLPQSRMIRFVRSPDGEAVPDLASKLPGRGVWVMSDRASIEAAVKKGAFARGFKAATTVPDALADRVEALLLKRCLDQLGLAKKSGEAVIGFDQVRAMIERKPPGVLIEAADGAEDGRRKVISLAKSLYGDVKLSGALRSDELGMAFGRELVIHALLKRGRFAKLWLREYARLAGFRDRPENSWLSERDR